MSIIDVIGTPVAQLLKVIHSGLSSIPGVGDGSGLAWGGSIVLLTVTVRLLLFPLFVKQIRSQRRMQEIAPRVKELQKLHKGDRETLNREMMKLYKDNNANPVAGCLPLVLQLPVFFALFSVLREFKPGAGGALPPARFGLSSELIGQGARARIFGAPISAALNDPVAFIEGSLGGVATNTRILAVIMLVTMGATTFITQKQMMSRNTSTDPTQMQIQKVMLYVLPLSFSVFGFSFPIGVLLYWLTTNLWSMGQQHFVIKKMPPPDLGAVGNGPKAVGGSGAPARPAGRGRGLFGRAARTPVAGEPVQLAKGPRGGGVATAIPDSPPVVVPPPPRNVSGRPTSAGSKSAAGSRKNKSRKKGRTGGRR